jgi:hypothetical protein
MKLKEEQEAVILDLLRTNREMDQALREKSVFTKDHVVAEMKSYWELKKDQERKLAGKEFMHYHLEQRLPCLCSI